MTLNEMIYHRRSCRSFLGQPVDSETIEKILAGNSQPWYVTHEGFRFFEAKPAELPGYHYIGSITI